MNVYQGRQIGSDVLAMLSASSSIAAWQEQLHLVLLPSLLHGEPLLEDGSP